MTRLSRAASTTALVTLGTGGQPHAINELKVIYAIPVDPSFRDSCAIT